MKNPLIEMLPISVIQHIASYLTDGDLLSMANSSPLFQSILTSPTGATPRELAQRGDLPRLLNGEGLSPDKMLRYAAEWGHHLMAEYAIEKGARPSHKSFNFACSYGHPAIVDMLLTACSTFRIRGVEDILSEGFSIACACGSESVVEYLIGKAVTGSMIGRGLLMACKYEQYHLVELLIDNGAFTVGEAYRIALWNGRGDVANFIAEKSCELGYSDGVECFKQSPPSEWDLIMMDINIRVSTRTKIDEGRPYY